MKPDSRKALVDAIAQEERHMADLADEARRASERLVALRASLDARVASPPEQSDAPASATKVREPWHPRTSSEKVGVFRTLFRGRADVFPVRFVSKRTGKAGYAPACRNKFVPGVCELPKIKCGECSNQAFLPVDDPAVRGHLTGRHVMGIYPLLPDETCWFLAIDFDKKAWLDDVRAFIETCRPMDVSPVVERSRSGNGAHVWFFFSEPVPAALARQMGSALITETMSRRHELSMDSYDRLFPSQDTMPRGGFGNLIALPLQHEPRQSGNAIFLNPIHPQLAALPDDQQWNHLASAQRMERQTIERIVEDATRRGAVIGLRLPDVEDGAIDKPWTRPPSRTLQSLPIAGPLPTRVRAVLAQRLFVEKAGLPSTLLNRIKRLAAFQNPEFYKKQNLRLSTALTPRVIICSEDLPEHIGLPRGCRSDLDALLHEYAISLDVDDQRVAGQPLALHFKGTLTPIQERAAQAILAHDMGAFVAPPGAGKTVVGSYLVAERRCNTLILVHRQPLVDQWRAQLALFLGLDQREIGQFGAGKRSANGRLDIAMIQSLARRGTVNDVVAQYGQVIVDECHHVPAASFERVLAEVKARFVVGLTATPYRRDGLHPIIEMQLGPTRFVIDARSQAGRRPFSHCLVVRDTTFRLGNQETPPSIQELYGTLAKDERRNQLILDDVISALEEGRSPLLLTERRDHLEFFAARLKPFARHLVVLHGGSGAKERRVVREQLQAIPPNDERLVLATGRYIGEGFDDARLDTLFLALPVSWRGTLVQYSGRLHRLHPGKTDVRVVDYVDREVPMLLRMFRRRLRGYQAIGYAPSKEPPDQRAAAASLVVEYDEPH
jgi:superfamily II DNA or RNA helicase